MLKSLPKIITIIFLTVFILQMICLFFLLVVPAASQAADIKFKPQVGIPVQRQAGDTFDFSGNTENTFPKDGSIKPIAEYIRAIYKYAIGIVGILAAVVLMIGGVMWVVAGGSSTMISEAKAWIGASLTGLILALCSYLILATINPALVDLKTSSVPTVESAPPQTNTTVNFCDPKRDPADNGDPCNTSNGPGYCLVDDPTCYNCLPKDQITKVGWTYRCCSKKSSCINLCFGGVKCD